MRRFDLYNVTQLRKLTKKLSLGSGAWRAGAKKAELIDALNGTQPTLAKPVVGGASITAKQVQQIAEIVSKDLKKRMGGKHHIMDEQRIRSIVKDEVNKLLGEAMGKFMGEDK